VRFYPSNEIDPVIDKNKEHGHEKSRGAGKEYQLEQDPGTGYYKEKTPGTDHSIKKS